jgi:hypothetical protein
LLYRMPYQFCHFLCNGHSPSNYLWACLLNLLLWEAEAAY